MTEAHANNTAEKTKNSRAKSGEWFRFDVDFENDPKIIALLMEHGSWGLGLYLRLVAVLYKNDGLINLSDTRRMKALVYQLRDKRIPKFISSLIDLGLFSTFAGANGEEMVRSGRVDRELGFRNELSASRRDAVSKRKDRQPELQEYDKPDTKTYTEQDNTEQTKPDSTPQGAPSGPDPDEPAKPQKSKPGKYTKFRLDDFNLPASWIDQGSTSLAEWVEYKHQLGKPCILKSYQQQVDKFSTDPVRFGELVKRAIEKGWQGLNEELPLNANNPTNGNRGNHSESFLRNMETRERLVQLEKEGKL
jgi:hypothetical protein